jgi:hypothetical protein
MYACCQQNMINARSLLDLDSINLPGFTLANLHICQFANLTSANSDF